MEQLGIAPKLVLIGFIAILIGMLLIIVGFLYTALRASSGEVGGVVVIGPIPIIFGTSERAVKIAVLAAIVLMVLAIVLMLLPYFLFKAPRTSTP
jgi:uncharacterized protein (TIGR00304 family)